ncbi:MAG: hypothetical protein HDS79_00105 [Bacteroidales bacterium]|nr:hypothetical protein [Bacteroidales bacterium]MDE7466278.1 hypothetical protein [Muribaculaceae bacterium]
MNFNELKTTIKATPDQDEAIRIISEYISSNPSDDRAFTLRGMKYWGAGKRALAINDYLEAIRINPDSTAQQALTAANEILDYRNKDLYNP